jgi:thiol:disulfide interchange protein
METGFRLFLNDPVAFVRESGLLWAVLFILIGGLALNLTPCVLPMIPINLAIIGAGAQAGSRSRGFALGATYGLGIALVYGVLGVIVVLTGSQFGTIQANPWFNLVIALIFVVLALAMFDVFHIDFSRFQSKFGGGEKKQGSFLLALTMGSVAALLAGACVAPVVIAVLLLATNIYEASGAAGLALPFVLGIGMALPWPFAGAGLSFLPKPGRWMEYVKYAFGIGIILFALYYGHLSYRAFLPAEVKSGIDGRTNEGFAAVLEEARGSGRPVLIDFTASWCKNCAAMEKTTFRDEAVKTALENVTFIKYVSEDPDNPNTKAVWSYFDVPGLPTFIVLEARQDQQM